MYRGKGGGPPRLTPTSDPHGKALWGEEKVWRGQVTSPPRPQGLVGVTFAFLPLPALRSGGQTAHRQWRSVPAGGRSAGHSSRGGDRLPHPARRPSAPFRRWRGFSQAVGICIAGSAAGRHWPALFPEVPGGRMGRDAGQRGDPAAGGRARQRRGAQSREAAGGETLTVGEKYRGEVGGQGCRVCLPWTATAPHFGHPRRV